MIWRSIIVLFVHFTAIILVLGSLEWIDSGKGLSPLLGLPAAAIIVTWAWLWVMHEASENKSRLEDYLESIDKDY